MTTLALPVHVALVDESDTIPFSELAEVAGALNQQVQADFAPVWKVAATVGAFPTAPAHTWAIRLRKEIGAPGALGYHTDERRQPYALVDVDAGDWTITASHELLEMLADPYGNRPHTAQRPQGVTTGPKRVVYLLEVCDPPEATSYEIGGVPVSDFLLPSWYRTLERRGEPTSYTGALTRPRLIAPGGYVSWSDPGTHEWHQAFADQRGNLTVRDLGTFNGQAASLRQWSDHNAEQHRARHAAPR